jgi:peptide/nickel transport system permease protein
MITFLRKRIVSSAIPLVVVVLGVFVLARLTGDPVNLYLPLSATAEQRAEFAAAHGFDQPILAQLWDYLGQVVRLDFGESLRTGQSAGEMLLTAVTIFVLNIVIDVCHALIDARVRQPVAA